MRALLLLLLIGALGCAEAAEPSGDADAGAGGEAEVATGPLSASLELPDYPYEDNAAVVIDVAALQARADDYCALVGAQADAAAFFLGHMPLEIAAALAAPDAEAEALPAMLGALYLSGYYGGLWLRDRVMREGEGSSSGHGGEGGSMPDMFSSLVDGAAHHLEIAQAPDDQLTEMAGNAVGVLLMLYGYNRGYLEVVLEHPPADVQALPALDCPAFMGCTLPGGTPGFLEEARAALPRLAAPPSEAWEDLAGRVDAMSAMAIERGRSTWEGILSDASLDATDYPLLIDLSGGYLAVSEATVLASMIGFAEADPQTARAARRLQAALTVWSESYFLGLASEAEPGVFPTLRCELTDAPDPG
jgi:hypothetical protein